MARLLQSTGGASRADWHLPTCRHGCKAGAASREERGAQPQGQMCVCLCPLARGRWGGLPLYRLHWETKHELPASCLQGDNDSLSRSVSAPMVLSQDCCSKQKKKVLWRRRSTNYICVAVLRETAEAEGLHHRNFASWDPNTSHLSMENVPLTMPIYTVLLQGLCFLQQS